MSGDHSGNADIVAGPALHAVAARLRTAAVGIGTAGAGVRNDTSRVLGEGAWLGKAAREAHRARAGPAFGADQAAASLRRAAAALDRLATAMTESERKRSAALTAPTFCLPSVGNCAGVNPFAPQPVLGDGVTGKLAALRAADHDADARCAAALRQVSAELHRLRLTTVQPVDVLIDSADGMLLRRLGLMPRPILSLGSVQQAGNQLMAVLSAGDAVAVRAYIESLPQLLQQQLVVAYPQHVGSGDGIPPAMRYAANRLVMAQAHALALRGGQGALARRLTGWLRPGRQFLLADLAGGRVAEVLGDLETAAHLAVVVPGMLNDTGNFDRSLRSHARALHDQVARAAPGQVATIAWLGYRTPGLANAALDSVARANAGRLRDLVAGLVLRPHVTTTVVAHSYGSLLAGFALRQGLRVDAVVAMGSPGMGTRTAAGLHAPAGTRIFAGRAPGDPVAWSENFGRDPSDPRFGIPRIATGDPTGGGPVGHTSYLRGDTECMRNLRRIVTGRYDDVTTVKPDRLEQAAAGAGEVSALLDAGPASVRAVERALATALPPRMERTATDAIEAQERAEHLTHRLRDPDLYAQIAGEARSMRRQPAP